MGTEHKRPLYAFVVMALVAALAMVGVARSDAVGGLLRERTVVVAGRVLQVTSPAGSHADLAETRNFLTASRRTEDAVANVNPRPEPARRHLGWVAVPSMAHPSAGPHHDPGVTGDEGQQHGRAVGHAPRHAGPPDHAKAHGHGTPPNHAKAAGQLKGKGKGDGKAHALGKAHGKAHKKG